MNKYLRKLLPNPLDFKLRKARKKGQKKILLFWNRGLGDIALGLYAICQRIREYIPNAEITFLTRPNLKDGFTLLGGVKTLTHPKLKRGEKPDIADLLLKLGEKIDNYDLIIDDPNPTEWVSWQLGKLTPKLNWQKKWDPLFQKYNLDSNETYIGAHVQTETSYGFDRNWPIESWHTLFEKLTKSGKKVLLFGFEKDPIFDIEGVIDLRGETPLFDLISIIKNRCEALIVPDSGVSSMIYYLSEEFPIKHISLWSNPYMGILKQNVASPNPKLQHIPLLGKDKDIKNISPEDIYGLLH